MEDLYRATLLRPRLLTGVRDHVTFQLVGGDELLVTCVAVEDLVNLQQKRKEGPSFLLRLKVDGQQKLNLVPFFIIF